MSIGLEAIPVSRSGGGGRGVVAGGSVGIGSRKKGKISKVVEAELQDLEMIRRGKQSGVFVLRSRVTSGTNGSLHSFGEN